MAARPIDRDDSLGVVSPINGSLHAVDPGSPAGQPRIGDDQQAGRFGRHLQDRVIGISRDPCRGGEWLPGAGRERTQGISTHQNGDAGIRLAEVAEDGGLIFRGDRGRRGRRTRAEAPSGCAR